MIDEMATVVCGRIDKMKTGVASWMTLETVPFSSSLGAKLIRFRNRSVDSNGRFTSKRRP